MQLHDEMKGCWTQRFCRYIYLHLFLWKSSSSAVLILAPPSGGKADCKARKRLEWRESRPWAYKEGVFIYITWCCQGVSSSASILQGWSARLHIDWTVFGNQDCSGTINTRRKQHTLSPSPFFFFFSPLFSYKMVQTTIQNICAVDNLHKKVSWLDNCAIFFFLLFFFFFFFLFCLHLREYARIPLWGLQPRTCGPSRF